MIKTSDFRLLTSCLNNAFMKLNFFCSSVLLFGFVSLFSSCQEQQQLDNNTHYIDMDIGGVGFLL